VRLGQQRLELLERGVARVQHAHPVVAPVHGMRHEDVQCGEVVVNLFRKQRVEGLPRNADVQPKNPGPIELGGVVEVAVILDTVVANGTGPCPSRLRCGS